MPSFELDGFVFELAATLATNPLHLVLPQLLDIPDPFQNVGDIIYSALLDTKQF